MELIIKTADKIFSRSLLVNFEGETIGVISRDVYKDLDRWDPAPALEEIIRQAVYTHNQNTKLKVEFEMSEANLITNPEPLDFMIKIYLPGFAIPDVTVGTIEATTILTQSTDNKWKLL